MLSLPNKTCLSLLIVGVSLWHIFHRTKIKIIVAVIITILPAPAATKMKLVESLTPLLVRLISDDVRVTIVDRAGGAVSGRGKEQNEIPVGENQN